MSIPIQVKLVDVGPRDGLQNEKSPVPATVKIELVQRSVEASLLEQPPLGSRRVDLAG